MRDLFKKIGDTKRYYLSSKDGHNKGQKWSGLNSSSRIQKGWQECTELFKKNLNDLDNHNDLDIHGMDNHTMSGMVTHLKPDILECEVEWALEGITIIKASGGDGISVELFQILKDAAAEVVHSICQQIWKTQKWSQDWKKPVFNSNPKERQCQSMFELPYNCTYFTF